MFQRIKAVFFDAGGTLFRPYPSVGEIYAKAASNYGAECDPEILDQAFFASWKKCGGLASLGSETNEEKEREWWCRLVKDVFSAHNLDLPQFDQFFTDLHRSFEEKHLWEIFPEVPEVLTELKKRRLIVGVVSNWDLRLAKLLNNLGLNTHLDFFVSSSLCGATKPKPKIFKQALALATVGPEEALHVGDTYEEDFMGAKALGINALHIERNGKESPAEPKFTIKSLQEILKLI